ncbi:MULTISPECIES: hypothetical protein [Haloarcula]|uniref:hypothetical protein n=1 Tax=Haloarcula TaxID=2237 RepID=UPI0023ED033D|nr:hypothetical protein [Halomicroarcula sp. XH51]
MGFLSGVRGTDSGFDGYDSFDQAHLPAPGSFLEGHDVLTGRTHAAFHRLTRTLFEERGVYDATFGYNLARLNLDRRHPDAGFRYAREREPPAGGGDSTGGRVLRASFTPTTAFCPQSDALTLGAFRAWNGLEDRHEYDLVRVRVDGTHDQSPAINGHLAQIERAFLETGSVATAVETAERSGQTPP